MVYNELMDWQVTFYMDKDGNEPVKEFILGESPGTIAEIIHVFKLLRLFNTKLSMPYVRKVDKSGLRELRIRHSSDLYRILYFAYVEHKFILLHAFKKKGDKLPEGEKRTAIKRMNDYISRYGIETNE
ncbi:MAG: type II toxin-antitoxin system RelE/ParE family toxin [Chloroflexi bacterium]|nr:type II toxin-antitoxin system RelE/ParE family toxin [Chloroflexota bacterium]